MPAQMGKGRDAMHIDINWCTTPSGLLQMRQKALQWGLAVNVAWVA